MAENHEKIEYEPEGEPYFTYDGYDVYVYATNGIVPDVIITKQKLNEQRKLWGFQGKGPMLVYVIHTEHNHPPDYPHDRCKKWSIYSDDPFPQLEEIEGPPEEVMELAMKVSDAPVINPVEESGKAA